MSAIVLAQVVRLAVATADPAGTWPAGSSYWNSSLARWRVYHSGAWTSQ